jgi:hypothetical protein
LKRVDLTRRFRLLGVRVGKLVKPGAAAEDLNREAAPEGKQQVLNDGLF